MVLNHDRQRINYTSENSRYKKYCRITQQELCLIVAKTSTVMKTKNKEAPIIKNIKQFVD